MKDRFSRERTDRPTYAGAEPRLHHVMCTECQAWSYAGDTKGEAQAELWKHRITSHPKPKIDSGSEG